jgi:hypothetical protein
MNKLWDNAITIAELMWETMKSEIAGGNANTSQYFHAKSILLNSLSYIEACNRKKWNDEENGSPTRNESEL